MPEVVQLRIHGVGGATPEGLLGLPDGAETIRVAGDEGAGFYARPADPSVQGYVWWKLTGASAVQALWIVLLPFTLFNVANWMYPSAEERSGGWARISSRFLMFLLGLSLTLTYLMWEFTLIVQQLFYQWSLGGHLDALPGWLRWMLPSYLDRPTIFRASAGMAGVVVVGFVVYFVARRTRRDFEEVHGPEERLAPAEQNPAPAVLGFPLLGTERLSDRSFWSRGRDSARLLQIHMAAGAVLFAALVPWTLLKANHPSISSVSPLHLRPWFVWLARVQVALLVLLLALYFLGWGWRSQFRVAPPVVVAVVSVALTTGFFSGFTYWVANRTNTQQTLDFDQSGAFGIGSVAFVVALLAWLGWHWMNGRREAAAMRADPKVPRNTALPEQEPNGLSPSMIRWVGLLRSFSGCITRIDLILTVSSLAFLAAAVPAVFTQVDVPHGFLTFGALVLTALVGTALPALLFRSIRPSARAKVKIIWDATTFWPRGFHPFAVRPYAERAVPEIQGRLYELVVNRGQRVLIAAHSQGTVLAHCALVHLHRWHRFDQGPDINGNVALVTFGCPLLRMHARFFPAYFAAPDDFDEVRDSLYQGGGRKLAWTNFYRLTDYVGQRIFGEVELEQCDREIPDPPERPSMAHIPLGRPWIVPPDPPQPIFTHTMVHSFYNNAVELREMVDGEITSALRGEPPP